MKKLGSFLYLVKHSLFPFDDFYIKIKRNTPLLTSLRYLVFLVFILTVLLCIVLPAKYAPIYHPQRLQLYLQEVLEQYPKNATIVINDNGILSSSHNRPIFFFSPDNKSNKLVVIDTQANDNEAKEHDSLAVLTRKKAYIRTLGGSVSIDYLKNQPYIFTDSSIQNLQSLTQNFLNFYILALAAFFVISATVVPFFFVASKLIYIGVASIFVHLVAKNTFIKKLKFKNTYQIALHAATGPIILEYASIITGLHIPVKFWFFVLTLIFIFGALYEAYLESPGR